MLLISSLLSYSQDKLHKIGFMTGKVQDQKPYRELDFTSNAVVFCAEFYSYFDGATIEGELGSIMLLFLEWWSSIFNDCAALTS